MAIWTRNAEGDLTPVDMDELNGTGGGLSPYKEYFTDEGEPVTPENRPQLFAAGNDLESMRAQIEAMRSAPAGENFRFAQGGAVKEIRNPLTGQWERSVIGNGGIELPESFAIAQGIPYTAAPGYDSGGASNPFTAARDFYTEARDQGALGVLLPPVFGALGVGSALGNLLGNQTAGTVASGALQSAVAGGDPLQGGLTSLLASQIPTGSGVDVATSGPFEDVGQWSGTDMTGFQTPYTPPGDAFGGAFDPTYGGAILPQPELLLDTGSLGTTAGGINWALPAIGLGAAAASGLPASGGVMDQDLDFSGVLDNPTVRTDPSTGLPVGAAAAAGTSWLANKLGITDKDLGMAGGLLGAGLGAFGASQQAGALENLAAREDARIAEARGFGAPYRQRLSDLYADPSGFLSSPEVSVPVQQGTDAVARALSAKVGNPVTNPGALQEIQNYASNQLFGRLGQEKDRLAGFGGLTAYNQQAAAGPNLQPATAAIGAQGNVYNAVGAGIADVTNPRTSLADLYKQLRSYTGSLG